MVSMRDVFPDVIGDIFPGSPALRRRRLPPFAVSTSACSDYCDRASLLIVGGSSLRKLGPYSSVCTVASARDLRSTRLEDEIMFVGTGVQSIYSQRNTGSELCPYCCVGWDLTSSSASWPSSRSYSLRRCTTSLLVS